VFFLFWIFAKRKGNKNFQDSFCKKQPLVKATSRPQRTHPVSLVKQGVKATEKSP